jgi:maltooligosyltrehalose trehalohydrolase
MRFGARIDAAGVTFRVWAPKHNVLNLSIASKGAHAMRAAGNGWHELHRADARPGDLYKFVLPDGLHVPDPASRFQPQDVHGPSEVIDPASYAWQDVAWRGRPWEECILYELHIGTFTREGTFRAAIARLDDLVALGITAIELMPVADFPGTRNWGYDGVLWFAPDSSYGRPDDLKALIDAAHACGLMVFLDVVYNHFGPDGNYLATYAPIFTDRHKTAWGDAIDYDAKSSDIMRAMVVANALYWIGEYHFDGLRFDAVHAIIDGSDEHLLEEIARRVSNATPDRHVHLVLENDDNEARYLRRGDDGRSLQYTAQWNDDLHHALHAAASGERSGYYIAYAGDTERLGRALAEGFAFQGEVMEYRGAARGEPSAALPPTAFVSFIQNHDQIGNRAFGERITQFAPQDAVRAVAAISLLSPQIPMLFMGEEWGAAQPFPFFCDFHDDLADAVREGRRAEFERFPEFADPAQRARIPDPNARETFESAKLRWDDRGAAQHARWLDFYRDLLRVRHADIIPRLKGIGGHAGHYDVLGDNAVRVVWAMGDGTTLTLHANLGAASVEIDERPRGRRLWSEGAVTESVRSGKDHASLMPWTVVWTIDSADDANGGTPHVL